MGNKNYFELLCPLLEIKDIQIRLDTILQGVEAADRGIHTAISGDHIRIKIYKLFYYK
jgi:hypothetical protein